LTPGSRPLGLAAPVSESKTAIAASDAKALKAVAEQLQPALGAQVMALLPGGTSAAPPRPELLETDLSVAGAKKRQAQKTVDACVDVVEKLQEQTAEANVKLIEALKGLDVATAAVQEATRRTSQKVFPEGAAPKEAIKINLDALLADNGEQMLDISLGESIDLTGDEFTDEDRKAFTTFKDDALKQVSSALKKAFGDVSKDAQMRKDAYKEQIEKLTKKRKTNSGVVATGPPAVEAPSLSAPSGPAAAAVVAQSSRDLGSVAAAGAAGAAAPLPLSRDAWATAAASAGPLGALSDGASAAGGPVATTPELVLRFLVSFSICSL